MRWAPIRYQGSWAFVSLLVACGGGDRPAAEPVAKNIPTPAEVRRTVLFVGTSLTAGLGLDPSDAYPMQLQGKVDSAKLPFRIVNAGVSGETSAGTLRRIDWLLAQGPVGVVVIETGANDGLRGQSIDSLRSNLNAILTRTAAVSPAPVMIVAGMEALPNMGRSYGAAFRTLFSEVASAHRAHYLPFLLDGVAGVDSLNQADGIHPTRRGARIVADNVWRVLGPILDSIAAKS
jgi:acyl-CoA thioesterase-1